MIYLFLYLIFGLAITLPSSYVLYLALPYTDARQPAALNTAERRLLHFSSGYPLATIIVAIAIGPAMHTLNIGPYYFKDYSGGIFFTAGHTILSIIGAATARRLYKKNTNIILFVINSIVAAAYLFACFAIVVKD